MSNDDDDDDDDSEHERIWRGLYERVVGVLDTFGRQDSYDSKVLERGDYLVVGEDWGWNIVETEVDLHLIRPHVVKALQVLLADYPDWMISMKATLPSPKKPPGMGLFIYPDRIVDDLQRDYLPPDFRDMRFG